MQTAEKNRPTKFNGKVEGCAAMLILGSDLGVLESFKGLVSVTATYHRPF